MYEDIVVDDPNDAHAQYELTVKFSVYYETAPPYPGYVIEIEDVYHTETMVPISEELFDTLENQIRDTLDRKVL